MTCDLLLGIDGGGSGCRARLTDRKGRMRGEGSAGPASLSRDLEGALAAVHAAASAAMIAAGLDPTTAFPETVAVAGLAGAVAGGAGAEAARRNPGFGHWIVVSDSEIACRGAHGGRDGGLVVTGTGSQGVAILKGEIIRIGGWGFQISDGGSGAVVGRAALRHALAALEQLEEGGALAAEVIGRIGAAPDAFLAFARTAQPADHAAFAGAVFAHANHDPAARTIRDAATTAVERLARGLLSRGAPKVALAGGLARFYAPLLAPRLGDALVAPLADAPAGALMMAAALSPGFSA